MMTRRLSIALVLAIAVLAIASVSFLKRLSGETVATDFPVLPNNGRPAKAPAASDLRSRHYISERTEVNAQSEEHADVLSAVEYDQEHFRLVVVAVHDQYARGLSDADVFLSLEGEGGRERGGRTDSRGMYALAVPRGQEIVYFRVEKPGFASVRRSLWAEGVRVTKTEGKPVPQYVRVMLSEAASLTVRVADDQGLLQADHRVELYLTDPPLDEKGQVRGELPEYAVRRVTGSTDARGLAILTDLLPGAWDVWAPRWRTCKASQRIRIQLEAGEEQSVAMEVQQESRSWFASGTIHLPHDASREAGCIGNYYMERTSEGHGGETVYDGGYYAVFGAKGERVRLRVKGMSGGTFVSNWFEVVIGEHDVVQDLAWEPMN